jgi:hypothetical protein
MYNLTANIGHLGLHCNSLVHSFLLRANVFTFDSNEHYFRSRNRALPQDSHSLRASTRDLLTECILDIWYLLYTIQCKHSYLSTV